MKALIKSGIKLLFRAKIFWVFLLVVPFLSILMIRSKAELAMYQSDEERIEEIEDADAKVGYYGNAGQFVVKLYDASMDGLSEYLVTRLAKTGMITVCRADVTGDVRDGLLAQDFVDEHVRNDGYEDRMGAAVFIAPDFAEKILGGNEKEAVSVYALSDDKRIDILERELDLQISKILQYRKLVSMQKGDEAAAEDVLAFLESADAELPEKSVKTVNGGQGRSLTEVQVNQQTRLGYAFSFLTFAFVFCGIFIAQNTITEQKNGVLVRAGLAGVSTGTYFSSKFLLGVITSLIVTAVVGGYSFMIDMEDLGMGRGEFIVLVFLMGLIFCSISVLLGILMGDVLSSCIAAFTVWCMSSLLSGLYFPLNYTTAAVRFISSLMPQRWFMDAVEMIYVNDNHVINMLSCVAAAYIISILSIGALGLKMKRAEEWGSN